MSCVSGGAEDDGIKEQRRQNKLIDQQLKKDKKAYKALHRLLLLGECPLSSFLPLYTLTHTNTHTRATLM